MTRWGRLQAEPERLWVSWNPDGWWVRPEVVALAVVLLLFVFAPWVVGLFEGRRHSGRAFLPLFMGAGLLVATAIALVQRTRRLNRRADLATRLRPADWVCAKCLHAEPERPG